MEETLYLSDLDGTLLRSDQTLSARTCATVDRLVRAGVHFSYATARSIDTAARVTRGIGVDIPVIVHNGARCGLQNSRRKRKRRYIRRFWSAGCFRSPMP